MYLIDTNVVSELRRPRPHASVLAWFESVDERHIFLSAVTMGEIQAGIENLRGRDASRATDLQRWADAVMQTHVVLPMDAAAFRLWARLMHGRSPHLYEDAMIAATASLNGLTVVTRNTHDFRDLAVATLDPFAKG